MADALGAGFRRSVWMVADELGFDLDPQLRTTHEMAVATAPIDSPIGTIEPGRVAAQRFLWEGLVDGEPVVTAAVNWLMGEEHLDPGWRFGPAGERFEVEVTGDPSCLTTFQKLHPHSIEEGLARNPGIVATAIGFVVLSPSKRLDTWLRCEQKATLVVRASNGNIPELSEVLNPLRCHVGFLSLQRTADGSAEVTFELRWLANDPDASARAIVNALSNTHDVADFSMKSMTT
jgi:hypothetical protein